MKIKHISNVFGDSATVTIKGTNNQNKDVSVSNTTTFPDLAQYPTINLFEINTTSVNIGEIAIIKWRVSNATKVHMLKFRNILDSDPPKNPNDIL